MLPRDETPSKLNTPFDKQQIHIFREIMDKNGGNPYDILPFSFNWLWFSQAVAAMEKGLE